MLLTTKLVCAYFTCLYSTVQRKIIFPESIADVGNSLLQLVNFVELAHDEIRYDLILKIFPSPNS